MQIRNIVVLLACALLFGAACTKGGGGVTPPDPKLGFRTDPTATAGRDSVIFGVSLNMTADVTISTVPDDNPGANNTKSWHGITNANLVVRPVAYSRPYTATITASAAGEETVSRTVRFTSGRLPDPCLDDSASLDYVDVEFVWRPATPDFTLALNPVTVMTVCGANTKKIRTADQVVSIDGGKTFRQTFRGIPVGADIGFQFPIDDDARWTRTLSGSEMNFTLPTDPSRVVNPSRKTSFTIPPPCPVANGCQADVLWLLRVDRLDPVGYFLTQ